MRARLLALALSGSLAVSSGCASGAVIAAEQSLAAAEPAWDAAYTAAADRCEAQHAPRTPEMRECFGSWARADEGVSAAIRISVAAIRAYWRARAAGEHPRAADTVAVVASTVADLAALAAPYFRGVGGRR